MSADGNEQPGSQDGCEETEDLLPVRMLNEYAYCPRLFHLMHVEGRWADNNYTVEGRNVHQRADKLDHVLPDADQPHTAEKDQAETAQQQTDQPPGDEPPEITRSVILGSTTLGITGKLDLVSTADEIAVPVETKRGRPPNNEHRCYEPERVQLMAQGMLLREHGYQCDHGVIYFAASRTRVDVPFTPELEARTIALIQEARTAADETALPPPLDDSPKCIGCSLSGICLPDETLALAAIDTQQPDGQASNSIDVRRLYPVRDNALPLYVQEQGAVVGKSGRSIIIRKGNEQLGRTGFAATYRLARKRSTCSARQAYRWCTFPAATGFTASPPASHCATPSSDKHSSKPPKTPPNASRLPKP